MENLKNAISLLSAVVSTMDTIPIAGIDNQDRFVGCANAVKTAARKIQAYIEMLPEEGAPEPEKQEADNG